MRNEGRLFEAPRGSRGAHPSKTATDGAAKVVMTQRRASPPLASVQTDFAWLS